MTPTDAMTCAFVNKSDNCSSDKFTRIPLPFVDHALVCLDSGKTSPRQNDSGQGHMIQRLPWRESLRLVTFGLVTHTYTIDICQAENPDSQFCDILFGIIRLRIYRRQGDCTSCNKTQYLLHTHAVKIRYVLFYGKLKQIEYELLWFDYIS